MKLIMPRDYTEPYRDFLTYAQTHIYSSVALQYTCTIP